MPKSGPALPPTLKQRITAFIRRHERAALTAGGVLAALAAMLIYRIAIPGPAEYTQRDIDAAVLHTLEKQPPAPSRAAVAYNVIRPSVVLVRRLALDDEEFGKPRSEKSGKQDRDPAEDKPPDDAGDQTADTAPDPEAQVPKQKPGDSEGDSEGDKESQRAEDEDSSKKGGLGTGVVFSDEGLIFTCFHVIAGAERIGVMFGDGTESEVDIVSVQPENDLAVLRARTLPDDLIPATLRSTSGLNVGDEVVAVGFPFGIGPSVTYGVVSGLRREHFSEEGQRNLIDLIQFDAAANPGNSGGPLVTADGDVVGIVTSILNPTEEGFFVGIAFAVPIENAAAGAGLSPF
ncbi:MAG: trypsin-like peptidase domain-containing protein [Rhodobacteraceae bacterium]|nr:trypsin-like peptidase domain-containing protein [Paracoccaceae bacterium]